MSVDLVGRAVELEALDGFLGRVPGGRPVVLVLEGEAGIGKSSLWLAGVEAARERGFRVLSSRPAEVELGVAHAGLGDLLEDALDEVLPELAPPRRRALEVALLVADDADEPVDFRTLAVAVRTALHLLAESGPVLVAIDDVQWLDASSTDALAFALRRLDHADVRILLARRLHEGSAVSALEAGVERHLVERLHVGPLSPGALQGILQRQLGRVLARPTLLRLHEAAGGNPFFALELARALGRDSESGDPTRPLPVPKALEELVEARLAKLPDESRAALVIVAAAGRPTAALLRAAHVDQRALEPAITAGVITVAGGDVRFTHPLLSSVLYQRTRFAERQSAHGTLAEVVPDPVARARHLALAADGPDDATAAVLEEAVAVALGRGAPIVAAELGEHAVRATPEDARGDRHRRSLAAAGAHLAAGEEERARTIAVELLGRAPAGPARAEALALMSELEGLGRAVDLLEEAIGEAGSDPRLQGKLHQAVAGRGRLTRGRAWAEGHARAALAIAEHLDDDALRAGALSVLGALRFDAGDPDGAKLAERGYELACACGDRLQLQEAGWALGHVLLWSVDTDRARSFLEARSEEEASRDERASAESLWHLAVVELRGGCWQAATEHARRSFEISTQYGSPFPQMFVPLALIAAHRGELERAAELAARARELSDREEALLGSIVALGGLIEFWSGDSASAVLSFAAAEEMADAADWHEPTMRWWRADYVEALLELGRVDDAVAVVDVWEEAARRVGRQWVLAQVVRCRGLIGAAQGDVDEAIATLGEAVASHDAIGDPFGRARALLALGVTRRRARQKRPAREAIEAALAGFEALGAAGWAEKARAELGRIGGRTRVEGLTAPERRVATLAAEGRTNREVAAALFLAEPTVASHLSHVYAKLGVRSRTELAGKLHSS